MRKLLQVVVAGLTAVSFSALAADKTEVDANTKIQSDTQTGTTEKSTGSHANSAGNAGVGASTEIKTDKTGKKAKKSKQDRSAAGGTTPPKSSSEGVRSEPAPAPVTEPKKAE